MKPTALAISIAWAALLSGTAISGVAAYYSISGLMAIFAGATTAIMIMGIVLETGKIVASIWLKQYWLVTSWPIRSYLIGAIIVLMLITSMGIFGLLSKSHADQALTINSASEKLVVYDNQLAIETGKLDIENKKISDAEKEVALLDRIIDQTLTRTENEQTNISVNAAERIRNNQKKERTQLAENIALAQQNINDINLKIIEINQQRAPEALKVADVEAKVGPIKYIAMLLYGDADPTLLEKAVVVIILMLVLVFDPLALVMVLAAVHSFQKLSEYVPPSAPPPPPVTHVNDDKPSDNHWPPDSPAVPPVPPLPHLEDNLSSWGTDGRTAKPLIPTLLDESDIVVDLSLSKNVEEEKTQLEISTSVIENEVVLPHVPPRERGADESRTLLSMNYVQNEEQSGNSLWSTVSSIVSQKENINPDTMKIKEMVNKIKFGLLTIDNVPEEYKKAVIEGLINDA